VGDVDLEDTPPHIEVWRGRGHQDQEIPSHACAVVAVCRRAAETAGAAGRRPTCGRRALDGVRASLHPRLWAPGWMRPTYGVTSADAPAGAGDGPGGVDAARDAALVRLDLVGRRRTGRGDLSAGRAPRDNGHRAGLSPPAAAGDPGRGNGDGQAVQARCVVTQPGCVACDAAGISLCARWAILGSNQ
jgi:hypothetical protein